MSLIKCYLCVTWLQNSRRHPPFNFHSADVIKILFSLSLITWSITHIKHSPVRYVTCYFVALIWNFISSICLFEKLLVLVVMVSHIFIFSVGFTYGISSSSLILLRCSHFLFIILSIFTGKTTWLIFEAVSSLGGAFIHCDIHTYQFMTFFFVSKYNFLFINLRQYFREDTFL